MSQNAENDLETVNEKSQSPFRGLHWPTAISVGGFVIVFFGFVSGLWLTNDAKIDELHSKQHEADQEKIAELEGVAVKLATTEEKLKQAEFELTRAENQLATIESQAFEQKFRAEEARSEALTKELESLKAQAAQSEVQKSSQSDHARSLEDKLLITQAERDQLRELYTREKKQPEPRNADTSEIAGLKLSVRGMASSDARDAIISGVQAAGKISAADLAEMASPLASDDQLFVITALSKAIIRPINAQAMQALVSDMASTDKSKALQVLSSKK